MELSPLPVMFLLILLLSVPCAQETPRAVLTVSPQSWLPEGESVTLSCEVTDSFTDWTFSWYTTVPYRNSAGQITYKEILLSNSNKGSRGSYTLSSAALKHTGVYTCSAERDGQQLKTDHSLPQPLWITSESPSVSLIINPNRAQHFTDDSLTLSCEDESNSTGWIVRRYILRAGVLDCSRWESFTRSTCKISLLSKSHTGVYWCESESGENSNPVNITVNAGDVILESPVHPVTEGHPLTLRCLDRNTNLRAVFYKDGSVLQTQTTGEMIVHDVLKTDEGFYHCKYPGRGESLKSWVSVRGRHKARIYITPDKHVSRGERLTLRCAIKGGGDTEWTYTWYKNKNRLYSAGEDRVYTDSTMQEISIRSVRDSDSGVYTCRGQRRYSQRSEISDAVTLTVSETLHPVLSVSPQSWVTEGDSVTLSCEVKESSTNWTFSWYTTVPHRDNNGNISYKAVPFLDSSIGSGGSFTLSSAVIEHTGVYMCRGERGEPAFYTHYSNPQPLWITGVEAQF
ncbi:Fc receptor-like protein 2 [Clarias gariepinus]|uniref:obscurin-like n=1 Tax=Clarias gariepinus TaxID=13013 RepID=UPI00234CD12F|nr:obscurin-like [Clarias gariepinus]